MEQIQQRIIIKFLFDEGHKAKEIEQKLVQHYGDKAYKISTIKEWIRRFRVGQETFENEPRSGRPKYDEIDAKIKKMLDNDPTLSARSIALTLHVSDWVVRDRLKNSLGMKNFHLKIVPKFLTCEQKKNRVKFAKTMITILEQHVQTNFKYIITGDESWFHYHYEPRTQWVISRENLMEKLDSKCIERKMMVTVFLNGMGLQLIRFKDSWETINSEYFITNIISILNEKCQTDRPPDGLQWMIHYDNARPHVSKKVQSFLDESCFEKMPHPPYSPDLAPCDFGIFGTVKNRLIGIETDSEWELRCEITQIFNEFSPSALNDIFLGWMDRLKKCIQLNGDYIK